MPGARPKYPHAQQRYDRACYDEQHCLESGHHPTLQFLAPEKARTGTTATQACAYARWSGAVRGRSRIFDRIESSPRSKCLHLCGETPPDQRSNARVKAAGSEKLRAAEICASGSSVSDTSCRATSNRSSSSTVLKSRACRLEIAIERAPVDGEPARSVVAGAAAGSETLAQAAFQLIDQIGAGNRLKLADGSLGGASELGVGRAHS